MNEPVKVSQEARRTAVEIMADRWRKANQEAVLRGECDHWLPVRECARLEQSIRAQVIEEAAAEVETCDIVYPVVPLVQMRTQFAAAIRKLGEG